MARNCFNSQLLFRFSCNSVHSIHALQRISAGCSFPITWSRCTVIYCIGYTGPAPGAGIAYHGVKHLVAVITGFPAIAFVNQHFAPPVLFHGNFHAQISLLPWCHQKPSVFHRYFLHPDGFHFAITIIPWPPFFSNFSLSPAHPALRTKEAIKSNPFSIPK